LINSVWQDRIHNTEVLQICGITGVEVFLLTAHFRWTGHVVRKADKRLPKMIFYGQLEQGARCHGRPLKRYKNVLKANMKACSIEPKELEMLVADRSAWRATCRDAVQDFESDRVQALQEKRTQHKMGTRPTTGGFPCDTCGRICTSRIGLFSHGRTHL
jgi:hypothetical protein